jgi:hypothetical protein
MTDPSLDLVYADAEYIDAAGNCIGGTRVAPYSLENLLSRRTFIMQPSAFFRTRLARDVGGWRPELGYVADNDLWVRMAVVGRFARVPGVWSRYRFHEAQRDTRAQRIVREWEQAIEDFLPRLSPRLKRAARLGCRLTAYRYAGQGHWWRRTRALYAAVAIDPRCLLWPDFPRLELLQPARQVLSWCKQRCLRWLAPARKVLR